MRKKDLGELEEYLEARREDLMREGDIRADPNRADGLTVPDEDTQPLTEMSQVIASRRNQTRARELQAIVAALTRIRNAPDEFGECDDCGEDISVGRLRVRPWSSRCVACESQRSPRQSHRRRHAGDFVKD